MATLPPIKKIAHLPNHVAIIMDGNGRWAQQRRLPRLAGHRAGVESARSTIERLGQYNIKCVTLYTFSTENWTRPEEEVNGIFRLAEEVIAKETRELHQRNARLRHVGRLDELPPKLQQTVRESVELTQNNTGMTLSLAFNYGGRLEIVDAVRHLIADGIAPEQVDEELFSRYLYTADLPEVDLMIRTGAELRISNFLLWQAAYAEYYFTDVLWPDFTPQEVDKALLVYSQRQRRFGGL